LLGQPQGAWLCLPLVRLLAGLLGRYLVALVQYQALLLALVRLPLLGWLQTLLLVQSIVYLAQNTQCQQMRLKIY
jgi:hypothetical protein